MVCQKRLRLCAPIFLIYFWRSRSLLFYVTYLENIINPFLSPTNQKAGFFLVWTDLFEVQKVTNEVKISFRTNLKSFEPFFEEANICNVYAFSVWNCRTYLVEVQDKNKSGFISLILSFCLDNLLGSIYKIWKRCRKNVILYTLMPEVSIRLVICYSKLEKRTLNY